MRRSPKKNHPNPDAGGTVRVVGYVRCSDEGQSVSDFNTLDNQKSLIAQRVAMEVSMGEPWELIEHYVDDGFSGKNMERPELARLLRDIEAGQIQGVVVYKLDRITRSLADFFAMDRLMNGHNCRLISVKEQLDTSTAMGRMMRNLLLAFAEMEREVNSERVRDKMHAEARLGRHLGGGTPYGFDLVDRKLVPNPEEAKVVRLIFEKVVETRSPGRARDYINGLGYRTRVRPWKGGTTGGGEWTIQTIGQTLKNPRYKGTYTYDSVEIPDAHEQIVSPELWDLAQKIRTSRARAPQSDTNRLVGHTFLLQGLMDCVFCGTRMIPSNSDHRTQHARGKTCKAYYRCDCGQRFPKGEKCSISRYNAELVEAAVLGRLWELEADPETLEGLLRSIDANEEDAAARQRLQEVQDALRTVKAKIANMVEAVAEGSGIASLASRLTELERQETELGAEAMLLRAGCSKEREPLEVDDVRRWFSDIREMLKHATPEERKKVVGGLVRKVESKTKEAVRVTYNVLPALPAEQLSSCLNQQWLPGVDSNHEPDG